MDHDRNSKLYAQQRQTAQKYLRKKRFLVNIFKRNRNMIHKLQQTSKLITSTTTLSKPKRIRKEHIKQFHEVTNSNKTFATFPTMTNMKNISLITEIKFLRIPMMNSFTL